MQLDVTILWLQKNNSTVCLFNIIFHLNANAVKCVAICAKFVVKDLMLNWCTSKPMCIDWKSAKHYLSHTCLPTQSLRGIVLFRPHSVIIHNFTTIAKQTNQMPTHSHCIAYDFESSINFHHIGSHTIHLVQSFEEEKTD